MEFGIISKDNLLESDPFGVSLFQPLINYFTDIIKYVYK